MRYFLFSNRTYSRFFLITCAALLLSVNTVVAQCGFAAFNEGGTLTPINNTWSTVSVGSGTYVNFNITPGRIYSFGYIGSSALLPYVWDMTLSNSGGVMPFDNSLTPVQDPWTGGACPPVPRPESAEWYSGAFSGTISVNTHSWSAGTGCVGFVPPQGSAILSYKECTPSADPGSGSNVWNVEAFATNNIAIPIPAARYGYYVDNLGTNFNTQNYWSNTTSPATASTWSGCMMPTDYFTIRARRTGFPCGRYIISLVDAQDQFQLYVNGVLQSSSTTPGQIADMVLGSTDEVEIRMVATCGADLANVTITPQAGPFVIAPGTIGGPSDACEGFPIGNFTDVVSASGGVTGFNNGGSIIYSWEYSSNGGPYSVIPGANSATYNSGIIIPPGSTYSFIRRATDRCGNTDISNVITVTGRPTPNGAMSPATQTICPGSIPYITLNFTPGTGPFNISYTDGSLTYSRTVNNGDTLQLVPGTYDFTSITDLYGCNRTSGFTSGAQILQAQGITFSLAKADASCANVFDGRIDVTVFNGTPPLKYSLNGGPLQPGATFSGLYAGFYTVTVYDAYGCSKTDTITINNTYVISVSLDSSSNISCYGGADGSLTVHVNGGVPPYSYSRNGFTFQSSGTFTGLSAGNYIIVGRDSKGCTETVNVDILQPGQLALTIDSINNVLCNGDSTGVIYVTTTGGTPPYTYLWNDGATTEDNTGLQAGQRNVTVTDSKGCTATTGAAVTEPLKLFLNVAIYNDLLCFGDTSGAIDVTANGGVPPYSYSWSNGTMTEDLSNLTMGCYTVTVTDANGCSEVLTQCLTEPTPINSSVTGTDVVCFGENSGTADLTVSGGSPPYFYLWSTFDATQDVANLSGGLYYVIITDNNGCEKRDSILINEPTNPLTISLNVTQITCFNANDGNLDLTVTGGTPNYTFAWSNGATTEDLDSLPGGTYCVTVSDANGCTASACSVIINPLEIGTNYVVTDPLCFGDTNGAINLITSGGTPGYTFLWSSGDNTEDLSNKPAGTYYVTITDSRGCTKIDSAVITDPPALYVSGVIKHVSCFGYKDGAIDITAYGGTLPYSFRWEPVGESTEDLWFLPGGSDTVYVTDGHGCERIQRFVVNEPQPLVVAIASTNVQCFGTNTGSLVVLPSGGTTPYEYLWNDFYTDSMRTGVSAGRYVVLLTDSNGCHTYDTADVSEPNQIVITGEVTDVLCNGFYSGAIDITVTGGTGAFTYLWSNGSTTEDIGNLQAGTYLVTVTDENGCTQTATFTVNETILLSTTVSVSNPTCYEGSNGFISVFVTGGLSPYHYTWSNGAQGAIATNLSEGSYSVTISDANNCSTSVQASVNNPLKIDVTATPTPAKCFNTATGIVTITVTGGSRPYVYQLNGIIQDDSVFNNLLPGNYIVAVRDANGCEGVAAFEILAPSPVTVDLVAPQDVIYQGMRTQLIANATSPNSPIVQYIWDPLFGWDPSIQGDTIIFDFSDCQPDTLLCKDPYVSPRITTLFTVTVMNEDGCFGYDTVTVYVEVQPSSFIPTAFTPNGDRRNDLFEFDILGAKTVEISVFNRWGERVYYNPAQHNGIKDNGDAWDGTKDGKPLPYDTYVYQMNITYEEGINPQGLATNKAGTITIMR